MNERSMTQRNDFWQKGACFELLSECRHPTSKYQVTENNLIYYRDAISIRTCCLHLSKFVKSPGFAFHLSLISYIYHTTVRDSRNLSQERRWKQERQSKSGRYVCTRTHVFRQWATRAGCAAHFADETFFPTMRSVPGGRRRTRALDNGVTRNGTRRAAKCIMPRRRLQWASGGVHNGAKRGVAPRSIDLAFVFFLPFFFLFSSRSFHRATTAHTSEVNDCCARSPFMKFIEVIVRLPCNESRL